MSNPISAEILQSSSNDSEVDRAKRPAIQRRGFDCLRSVPSPGGPATARPAPDQFPHQAIETTEWRLRQVAGRRRQALKTPPARLLSIRAAASRGRSDRNLLKSSRV